MARLFWALCALALAGSPLAPQASSPVDFNPSDAGRFAINAVIGDASFVERYGTLPPRGVDPDLRVRTHLEFVHALLSSRDTSSMPAALRNARRQNLERLAEYIDAGVFPHNHLFADQNRPCFIDRDGRICAVGYLVEQSAGRAAAERINAIYQSEFLWQMELPELDRWIASSGLSLRELSMIQPCYNPQWYVKITRISDTTVSIKGFVYEDCCGMKYVAIDFGEAVWKSPNYNSWVVPVDIQHTYSRPGGYMITGTAVAVDKCYNQVERETWLVNVGAPPMALSAVQMPGGPPFRVYLTTADIDLDCLASSRVQWTWYEDAVPTTWFLEGSIYRTPVHEYDWPIDTTVMVANTYRGDCAVNQIGSLTVSVNGTATATAVSTWGRIKAMYR